MEIETWKHGDIDMRYGNMDTWKHGYMDTWKHGDRETWTPRHGDTDMETWIGGHGQGYVDMRHGQWRHGIM